MSNRTHQQMKNTRGQSPRNAPGVVRTRSGGRPSVADEPEDHVDDGCTGLGFVAAERPDGTHLPDWFERHENGHAHVTETTTGGPTGQTL